MVDKQFSGNRLHGLSALALLLLSTLLSFIPVFIIGLLKLVPYQPWRSLCTRWVDAIAMIWSQINNTYIRSIKRTEWQITGLDNLTRRHWYLVIANHQSWLDIVILQRLFNRKIPVLKFFIKDQLKWIPLLGFSWWAMGCPFMKRYSKEYLARKPHKKGQDLKATQKAIQAFRHTPVSIMNFVEGTRFTHKKNKEQNSPYQYLLKPRAGGIKFVLDAMGHQLNSILDVTIIYGTDRHSLWDFLCHRIENITVHVRQIPIPAQFCNLKIDNNKQTEQEFRDWLNDHWLEKDRLITDQKQQAKLII